MKGQASSGNRPAGKDAHLTARTAGSGNGVLNGGKGRATGAPKEERGAPEMGMEIRKEYFPLVLNGRK